MNGSFIVFPVINGNLTHYFSTAKLFLFFPLPIFLFKKCVQLKHVLFQLWYFNQCTVVHMLTESEFLKQQKNLFFILILISSFKFKKFSMSLNFFKFHQDSCRITCLLLIFLLKTLWIYHYNHINITLRTYICIFHLAINDSDLLLRHYRYWNDRSFQ